jgi:hypothetical protein
MTKLSSLLLALGLVVVAGCIPPGRPAYYRASPPGPYYEPGRQAVPRDHDRGRGHEGERGRDRDDDERGSRGY